MNSSSDHSDKIIYIKIYINIILNIYIKIILNTRLK